LAIEQDVLALGERLLEVGLVPPVRPNLAGSIDCREFKDPKLAAFDGIGSGYSNFPFDRRERSVFKIPNLGEIRAVFVSHRQIIQQVLNGDHLVVGYARRSGQALSKLLSGFNRDPWNLVKMKAVKGGREL